MSEVTVRFTFVGDDQVVLDRLIAWFESRGLDCTVGVSSDGHGYGTIPTSVLDDFRELDDLTALTVVPELEAA